MSQRPARGMKLGMRCKQWNLVACAVVALSVAACATPSGQESVVLPPLVMPHGPEADRSVLAGEWDYEDGAVVPLTLDEQGNGSYPWKGGRFETHSLSDHTWHGRWVQTENDREGGFTVQFSPDFSDGEGRWWYTRIADDLAPTQKGGTFRLTKKSSTGNDTPSAP